MMPDMTLGQAAEAIGVSITTLRRWDRTGRIRTTRDALNRRIVTSDEVTRLRRDPARHATGGTFSARNRVPGVVGSVEVSGGMALVEIDAGHCWITAAITRDSVEELGLAPGMRVAARVKATDVMIERADGAPDNG
jgi:molybdopterin-binding protein